MSDDRPNILWICTDQQRWDTLGCYDNKFVETPNLDGLAASGVRFDNAYCQNPICAPSRASFMTGRYPRTTGVRQNGQAIPESEVPVTKILDEAGYTCSLGGKLHMSPCHPENPTDPQRERRIDDGYADFHWSHSPDEFWPTNEYTLWLREKGIEPYDRANQSGFRGSEYVLTSLPAEHHHTTWCVKKGINFIEAAAGFDEPWLSSVNIFDPHKPFNPPEAYIERYLDRLDRIPLPNYEHGELKDKTVFQRTDHEGALMGDPDEDHYVFPEMDEEDHRLIRAAYWAMVDLIDDQVGRLLDVLERTGQRENTIIIFTSDHGEMLGDHGIYLKGPYFYEPAIRVPLLIAAPGVDGSRSTDALVELIDLAPTLLDAAGKESHPGMQGESLWPLLTGEAALDTHRESVYCEYYNAKIGHYPVKAFGTMVRTDRFKLVDWHGTEEGELYDLKADPTETTNYWADPDYADTKLKMFDIMADRMAETCDPLPERSVGY